MAQVNAHLSRSETLSLLSLFLACFAIIANTFQGDGNPLIASLAFSGIAYCASYAMIRWLGNTFMKAGLKGKDMGRKSLPEIPETMGAICAVVYLLVIIVFIPFPFYKDIVAATSGGGNRDVIRKTQQIETGRFLQRFPHSKLASYLSAILSLQSITILGVGDDLFDIRWRHKLFIPAFAAIPLLIVYFVDFGVTSIVIPTPMRPYLGELFDLGLIYYLYMAAFAIFTPNSINIFAGINGIEVSQSLTIALLIMLNDLLYILPPYIYPSSFPQPHPATDSHLFSLYLLLPFTAVSIALLQHNWYPARVFVGDTYCYFAGMVFVVVGILGHFSKTLWLLLIPQVFNFLYSAPQLFHFLPCPRHRLPKFNARTGLREPSTVEFKVPLHPLKEQVVKIAGKVGLVRVTEAKDEEGRRRVVECSNLTIINLWLVWFGPMREDTLAWGLTLLQAGCGLVGLFVRHRLAGLIFTADNL
ncbi:UDP-N-acetyl-glucosamine-1-P transferase Alg7 [Rhizodiscina lignyota]|uniref:UDP-N-acetylglucosamine--dolichyl-phosphate N-acetylglucosaminephosphotransferase n=1 Tax=Rhizodiscina lignyota TaxID=1504668 RepID=A0A9P4IAU6_9PEZI|nr:UDP-N-acetyl-glucosamine-1-P transferase Alg7 [Rhizodiscina lignyota]